VSADRKDERTMAMVLIIDDEESICKLLTKLVHQMGHQAETALSIREGLALKESTRSPI
jgi:DNA-binding NtrC family response regulator